MRDTLKMLPETGVTATVPLGVPIGVDSPDVRIEPGVGMVAAKANADRPSNPLPNMRIFIMQVYFVDY